MSRIYLAFEGGEAEAHVFLDEHAGFELVPGAHPLEAIYGDDRIDAVDDYGFDRPVPPRVGVGGKPLPRLEAKDMPRPWPVVVGYDGMPRGEHVGVAMKAVDGEWLPVAVFDPPLSSDEQAAANERALAGYADRRAEHHVLGSTGPSTIPPIVP